MGKRVDSRLEICGDAGMVVSQFEFGDFESPVVISWAVLTA